MMISRTPPTPRPRDGALSFAPVAALLACARTRGAIALPQRRGAEIGWQEQ